MSLASFITALVLQIIFSSLEPWHGAPFKLLLYRQELIFTNPQLTPTDLISLPKEQTKITANSPFNILTATLVTRFGFSLSRPCASPITTWPKQPSPNGFPRTSLQREVNIIIQNYFTWNVSISKYFKFVLGRSPFQAFNTFDIPVPGKLPAGILGQLILRYAWQHWRAAGGEAGGTNQHHSRVDGGARVHRHLRKRRLTLLPSSWIRHHQFS